MHPEIMRIMAAEHVKILQRDAVRHVRATPRSRRSTPVTWSSASAVSGDDPELERLAELDGRLMPEGRLVVAVIRGRIVAALSLVGAAARSRTRSRAPRISSRSSSCGRRSSANRNCAAAFPPLPRA